MGGLVARYPTHLCLQWNRQRQHPIAESVIEEHCAQLLQATGAPQRREGFAAVVRLETRHWSDLGAYIHSAYSQLETRIQAGALREGGYALHGYSGCWISSGSCTSSRCKVAIPN